MMLYTNRANRAEDPSSGLWSFLRKKVNVALPLSGRGAQTVIQLLRAILRLALVQLQDVLRDADADTQEIPPPARWCRSGRFPSRSWRAGPLGRRCAGRRVLGCAARRVGTSANPSAAPLRRAVDNRHGTPSPHLFSYTMSATRPQVRRQWPSCFLPRPRGLSS